MVKVYVKDAGIGIAPDVLPRVFELFVQEQQAIDRAQGGLGLGLAVARSLVLLHGGSLTAHSDGIGKGSEFCITLPVLNGDAADLTPPAGRYVPVRSTEHSPMVLIVDDNADAAELLAEYLQMLGYRTTLAYDAPAALALVSDVKPDIALLDIGLPVMDGYELAKRLRETEALANLKRIALTGYGQDSDRQRALDAGFNIHMVKPLNLELLEKTISTLLESAA